MDDALSKLIADFIDEARPMAEELADSFSEIDQRFAAGSGVDDLKGYYVASGFSGHGFQQSGCARDRKRGDDRLVPPGEIVANSLDRADQRDVG